MSLETAPTDSDAIESLFSLNEDEQRGEIQDYGSTVLAITCRRIHCLLEMGEERDGKLDVRPRYTEIQKDIFATERSEGPPEPHSAIM